MYIFLNRELGMSTGKAAAQAGHAAVEAYRLSNFAMIDRWYEGGHYCKLVMEAQNTQHMTIIERYLNDRGFVTKLIIDEGLTEIAPLSVTALGVEIVDRDSEHTKKTFEVFGLYKDVQRSGWSGRLPACACGANEKDYLGWCEICHTKIQ